MYKGVLVLFCFGLKVVKLQQQLIFRVAYTEIWVGARLAFAVELYGFYIPPVAPVKNNPRRVALCLGICGHWQNYQGAYGSQALKDVYVCFNIYQLKYFLMEYSGRLSRPFIHPRSKIINLKQETGNFIINYDFKNKFPCIIISP